MDFPISRSVISIKTRIETICGLKEVLVDIVVEV